MSVNCMVFYLICLMVKVINFIEPISDNFCVTKIKYI